MTDTDKASGTVANRIAAIPDVLCLHLSKALYHQRRRQATALGSRHGLIP